MSPVPFLVASHLWEKFCHLASAQHPVVIFQAADSSLAGSYFKWKLCKHLKLSDATGSLAVQGKTGNTFLSSDSSVPLRGRVEKKLIFPVIIPRTPGAAERAGRNFWKDEQWKRLKREKVLGLGKIFRSAGKLSEWKFEDDTQRVTQNRLVTPE